MSYKWKTIEELKRKQKAQKPKQKRISFHDTPIGKSLKANASLELGLIIQACGQDAPSADLIEAISYGSINKFFRTAEFRYDLIDYRKNGLYERDVS